MKKYKCYFDLAVIPVIGLAIGLENDQPKNNYKNANWKLYILIFCFGFGINLKYKYK